MRISPASESRSQARRDEDDVAAAGVDALAETAIGEAACVPVLIDAEAAVGVSFEAVQPQHDVDRRSADKAVRHEYAGDGSGFDAKSVGDAEVDLGVERGARRSALLLQDSRHGHARKRDRLWRWSRPRRGCWGRCRHDRNTAAPGHADNGKIIARSYSSAGVGGNDLSRDRLADVSADHGDGARFDIGDDVAMGRHPGTNGVIRRAASRPALADEIADLRRRFADPISLKRVRVVGQPVVLGGDDVVGVRGAVAKVLSGAGLSHHPGYESRAPGMGCLEGLGGKLCGAVADARSCFPVILQEWARPSDQFPAPYRCSSG